MRKIRQDVAPDVGTHLAANPFPGAATCASFAPAGLWIVVAFCLYFGAIGFNDCIVNSLAT
jgi:hypothetical protein